MADYILRDDAIQCANDLSVDLINDGLDSASYGAQAVGRWLEDVPAAKVVEKTEWDKLMFLVKAANDVLAENNIMREMLAQIGKKPGDKMDDVRPVVRGKWKRINNRCDGYAWQICSECGQKGKSTWNFCPNCWADMRPSTNDEKEV